MSLFKKLLLVIVIALILSLGWFLVSPKNKTSENNNTQSSNNEKPEVISTNPKFGEDPIVLLPNQTIEVTFNLPFENTGEVKNQIDPKADLKIELSSDRKTVKFTPTSPLKLGTSYTLSILPNSKFNISPGNEQTKKVLDHNIDLHFKTLDYRGI